MPDKKQMGKLSRHYCPNLGADVAVMEVPGGNKHMCLSSHLCGSDGKRCRKNNSGSTVM